MKKKQIIIVGFLLTLAIVLNLRTNSNFATSNNISLKELLSINTASAADDGEGTWTITSDCVYQAYICHNPFDPEDCHWYNVYGTQSSCLSGWPNLGCYYTACQ